MQRRAEAATVGLGLEAAWHAPSLMDGLGGGCVALPLTALAVIALLSPSDGPCGPIALPWRTGGGAHAEGHQRIGRGVQKRAGLLLS